MRRSTKKRLIPLALALALAIVGAALAVPTFNINVQEIGLGTAKDGSEILSPVGSATLNWGLDTSSNDPDNLVSVTLKFDQNLLTGSTIYVKFYDGNTFKGATSKTLSADLTAGNTVTIDVSSLNLKIEDFDTVKVIVLGPEQ